jgi:hypothetical protein
MMPDDELRQVAEMLSSLSPADRDRVTSELGMTDGPPRPKTSRKRPQDDPPVSYRTIRVRLF